MRSSTPVAFACVLSLAIQPRLAGATDCSGILSTCINDDTLWPHAGAARFAAVGSTETVTSGQLGFGLVTSYSSRPIVLHVRSPGDAQGSDEYAVNDLVNGAFLWSFGVRDRLELDLVLPLTFGQSGAGLAPVTGGDGLKDTAQRDMRFGFAYALLPHARNLRSDSSRTPLANAGEWGLAARFEMSAPTGDRNEFAGERSGVFVPSLSADYRIRRWFAGVEIGARVRPSTELLGARVGSQVVTALGAGWEVLPQELLTATVEAWALPTLVGQDQVVRGSNGYADGGSANLLAPAEWQLSARTVPVRGSDLSIQLGGGGGIPLTGESGASETSGARLGLTTPRFRFTLGVRWAPVARDVPGTPTSHASPAATELDLASAKDSCVDEPDLVDGFADSDGCPDEDQDKDGIDDRLDQCPLVPEDYAGLTDGCPQRGSP
jgi:OmpA-OmpF porin, OOP family